MGYTLGGGLPLLGRKYGFASDHAIAFDLVTPDGVLRRVDARSEPRLFSLLRGGKGNFGIVTAMEFSLFPAGELYAGGIFYHGAHAREVLAGFRGWSQGLPLEASASLAFLRPPDLEEVPGFLRGKFVMHLRFAWHGSGEEGAAVLAPMRAAAPVLVDVLLELAGPESQAPLLLTEIRLMGGALSAPLDGPAANADCVGGRDAALSFFTVGALAPPIAQLVPAAVDTVLAALKPYGTGGSLVNLHGHLAAPEHAASAWPEGMREELAAAKAELDPKNLFRHGHAVLPAAAEVSVAAA